jgi:hypothetical protein
MNIKQKIGWQKYEDMLEQQMQSPLLSSLYKSLYENTAEDITDKFTEEEIEEIFEAQGEQPYAESIMIPVDDKLVQSVNLVASFDCWMGHTNFNITEEVKTKLNSTEGVEVLKILSRYRFFVGIGRMFDFKDVRRKIERTVINQEKKIE